MASTNQYPRPDFQRTKLNWKSLNGPWYFAFDDKDVGLRENWHRIGLSTTEETGIITVPFAFQTPASGIHDRRVHEVIWYQKTIEDLRTEDEIKIGNRVLIRFGAVDYEATVWLNGKYLGFHRGGHVPFDLDITDVLGDMDGMRESAVVTIRVFDSAFDLTQPRGKQYWAAEPENIWYTPSSGIWQSVWLESVPRARIANPSDETILKTDDIASGCFVATISTIGRRVGEELHVEIEAQLEGVKIGESERQVLTKEHNSANFKKNVQVSGDQVQHLPKNLVEQLENGVALWSPENPHLYDLVIRLIDSSNNVIDEIKTTIGMRSTDWSKGDGTFRLNGRPYFQALVLDQGYWPDTGMTPPSPSSLKHDIELAKQMGFNGCRKHQKVEDPIFLYWADKLGFLVWGEMANAYEFSNEYVQRFNQEWMESVRRDINHPSIVTWTPVNESWGYKSLKDSKEERNHIRSLYYMTKTLDPTRSINDNCGWEHVITDLTTFHDYTEAPALTKTCASIEGIVDKKSNNDVFVDAIPGDIGCKHVPGAPIICTEFGGINIAPAQGEKAAGEKDWGYVTASDPKDLLGRYEDLVMGIVKGGLCCGFVYTQLTDIEQEVNGLYSFDRRPKLDVEAVKRINESACELYYDRLKKGCLS
ncbi:hypothetical protein E2P81_ATG00027 [Venturia nashicola]|uniref:Glycoside hydrolase family 2 protein n=1 Tax=Venturia nashicola TaxID=86259 RepID=A0A4Z1PML4_9PEZI|nr:hypothetical protein E6O75_ATG00031 [Venturia nashicola]TLD39040.1 hypothetical protein E2P81_ATG00027 [Venturia nashicola]